VAAWFRLIDSNQKFPLLATPKPQKIKKKNGFESCDIIL